MNVFVDTSAFYAALSKTDDNHKSAVDAWNAFMDDNSEFFTSNYVVVETCALVRNRLGDEAMRSFINKLLPLVNIIWIDRKVHLSAVTYLLAHGKNGPSLVDCASFVIIRDKNISNVLAFDRHFAAEGLTEYL